MRSKTGRRQSQKGENLGRQRRNSVMESAVRSPTKRRTGSAQVFSRISSGRVKSVVTLVENGALMSGEDLLLEVKAGKNQQNEEKQI